MPLILTHSVDRALNELAGTDDVIVVPGRGQIPAPPASHARAVYGVVARSPLTPLSAFHGSASGAAAATVAASSAAALHSGAHDDEDEGAGDAVDVDGGDLAAAGSPSDGDDVDDVEPEAPPTLAARTPRAPELAVFATEESGGSAGGSAGGGAPAAASEEAAAGSIAEALPATAPPPRDHSSSVALVPVPLLTVRKRADAHPP